MSLEESSTPIPTPRRRNLQCSTHFDALWFCYSPVHQMQQYYRFGLLDNCSAKWGAFFDCMTLKTKSNVEAEQILESREKAKAHIWSFRTPEEAAQYWSQTFGDPDEQP